LDTSAILDNPKIFELLKSCEIIIPFCVLTELDKKRKNDGLIGKNARTSIRFIDSLTKYGDLFNGVTAPNGSKVCVVSTSHDKTEPNDLKIVKCAFDAKNAGKDVVILSNDIGLRVHASGVGVKSEAFKKSVKSLIYSGISTIDVDKESIDDLYENEILQLSNFITSDNNFYSNQMIIMKSDNNGSSVLGQIVEKSGTFWVEKINKKKIWGISPLNVEQTMALHLLDQKSIELVSLVGKAGCGKTFLALASGLSQVIEQKKYERIILIRPIVSVGKEMGYLPGTIEEKMAPWIQPIKDNLEILSQKHQMELWFERGIVSIEPMSYIRGRSIPNSFIIVDECQNISGDNLKTILTRAAKGSKIVLTGDIEQIDDINLDICSNGLSYVVEKFKKYALSGHVTLQKGQRSDLANLAAEIL
jgi:PhoH-like ATPase